MVPVSIRTADQHGDLGNQVTAMMAPLPVWCEDPIERLGIVRKSMGHLKNSKQAVGANLLAEMTDFAPPTIASQAARLQSRQRFFNLVVTNVPGPQFPLYVLGRRLQDIFPMVPLAKRQAVCVGIMSYDGGINFGLIGDYEGMPALGGLAADLEQELDELAAMAPKLTSNGVLPGAPSSPGPRPPRPDPASDPLGLGLRAAQAQADQRVDGRREDRGADEGRGRGRPHPVLGDRDRA